ncbi:hypothetical protein [Mucilaginibacter sp. FT3.2]|uniref:hypothetical protein n=1 Tax=Mucilaginibacter sp. FT3.2 TaxID=2723090 RepID=UPI0016194770|nr:hypothetical protein [Mucilaginibacter sp. FT3.2]MBB6230499.1 hypothetical protein [Mucilaginibacter sp. FT3.2]
MKNLIYTAFALLLAIGIISGCNKITDPANSGKIVASKTDLKINEADSLALAGASATDSVTWSITPSGSGVLIKQKNLARVSFTKSGTYTVTAFKTGSVPASIQLKVSADSIPSTSDTAKFVSLAGDQITLSPGISVSPLKDSVGFDFNASTKNKYCSNGLLKYNKSVSADYHFNIDFLYVQEPKVCTGTTDIPMIVSPLRFNNRYLVNGTYPLTVTLNGTTYTGNVIITSTLVTFDWKYTTGVVMSVKSYNRISNTFTL